MTMRFTTTFQRDGKWFVAHCAELGVTSQGETLEEAERNLREAVELYLKDMAQQKIKYHKEEEILSIRFSDAKSVDSDIKGNVVIDYDRYGNIVGLDIMKINLDHFVPLRQLQQFAIRMR